MNTFPCTGCGECCRQFKTILSNSNTFPTAIQTLIDSFPYKINKDGSCSKLIDNSCSVYDNRPIICNIDLMGQLLYQNMKEWYVLSAKHCNVLINNAELDPKYLIQLPEND